MKLPLPFLRKRSRSSPSPPSPPPLPPPSSAPSVAFASSSSSSSSSHSLVDSSSSFSEMTTGLLSKASSSTPAVLCQTLNPEAREKSSCGYALSSSRVISPDERQELEEIFKVFDTNGDGLISALELGSVLRSLGDNPTEKELQLMVRDVDKDGDGFINLDEFITLNSAGQGGSGSRDELRDTFGIFDANKDGLISAEELRRVLNSLGDGCTLDDCSEMIRRVDADEDGHVNFEEFQRMMNSHQ